MSNLLNICGIVIASSQYPDATLQQFYRQYYHCEIKAEQIKAEVQSPSDLSMFSLTKIRGGLSLQLIRSALKVSKSLSITELDLELSCQTKYLVFHTISC